MTFSVHWKDEYNIDGGRLDREHKKLFALADRIFSIADPSNQAEEVTDTVKELYRYMEYHFDAEQKAMRKVGFPGYEHHVRAHKAIIDHMNRALRQHHDLDELLASITHIMLDWATHHIVTLDKKIAGYLKTHTCAANN